MRQVVTNSHVVAGGGRFLRANRLDGSVHITEIPPDNWIHAPLDDVATASFPSYLDPTLDIAALDWDACYLDPEFGDEIRLGVGDDVLMLGRLSSNDGIYRNQPVARFGNISAMPEGTVRDGRGLDVTAFLVEMRSLSGFSGSPAFGMINPGSFRGIGVPTDLGTGHHFLLGIDTGHIRLRAPIWKSDGSGQEPALHVQEHSGVSIVVPAWTIDRFLKSDAVRELSADSAAHFPRKTAEARGPASLPASKRHRHVLPLGPATGLALRV